MNRSSRFIVSFQEEFAKLLGVSTEEVEAIRGKIRDAVVGQYINGMAFLLKNNHDLSWKVLFRAAEALNEQAKPITVQRLVSCIGPHFRRKLNRKVSQSCKNPLRNIDKTPGNRVQVLQGGLTGVGGNHSRRSRGSGKS
ncbi:MAG: hypothetical protein HYS15_01130 [Candidatus Spechtbacteria bacterium]|nr:hypothetical protein [Candidatus Spechtbacteria bacterium]MBI3273740.1 hypothetical protein [Candidatus Colwellbacteria bacterium]